MLLVFFPVALVASSLDVCIDSVAVSLVVEPLPVVDVAVRVEELALPACLIVLPVTFVAGIIRPDHRATPVSQATLPLSGIDGSCLVRMHSSFQCRALRIDSVQCLPRLFALEIFTLNFARHLQDAVLPSLEEATDE